MIKAAFLDIDGTIISIASHKVPKSAVDTICRIRRQGVKVFLCTSRAKQFITNIPGIEYDGVVCLTGAHCYDSDGKNISCETMNPLDVANGIADRQRRGKALVGMAPDMIYVEKPDDEELLRTLALGGLTPESIAGGYLPFPDFTNAEFPVEIAKKLKIIQLTAYFRQGPEEDTFMSLLPHSHTERWAEPFTDIVSNGVNKGRGVITMAAHYGFQLCETLAAGDGANDIPMLETAAVGIAMGNASDDVKAAADYVTETVDNDGLQKALDLFIK